MNQSFHTDDEFEIVLVGVDVATGISKPISELTSQEINRLVIVPETLVGAVLERLRKLNRNTP